MKKDEFRVACVTRGDYSDVLINRGSDCESSLIYYSVVWYVLVQTSGEDDNSISMCLVWYV
jgi:hypothetical protein